MINVNNVKLQVITSGYFGISTTLAKVRQRFYWFGCWNDVETLCKQCEVCNVAKAQNAEKKLCFMERNALDVLGPLPKMSNSNKYLFIYLGGIPYSKPKADTTAKVLEQFGWKFGHLCTSILIRGKTSVQSVEWNVHLLGRKKTQTTTYHLHLDGKVECYNHTLEAQLSVLGSIDPIFTNGISDRSTPVNEEYTGEADDGTWDTSTDSSVIY